MGCGRADDIRHTLGDRECGLRRDRRAVAIRAVPTRDGAGGIERRTRLDSFMATAPAVDDRAGTYVSAAFRPENVAAHGSDDDVQKIVARGPRGAFALAGLSVAVLLAIWLAFFFFVFLPRGAVG